jgi:anti-sigma B factor antagonist
MTMKLSVTGTDRTAVVTPRGDFLGYDGETFRGTLADIRTNGVRNVVLDLGEATHIDTSIVGVVLGEARLQRALGGDLRIAGLESNARTFSLLTLTRVTESLACFAGVDQAVNSFDVVEGALAFAA